MIIYQNEHLFCLSSAMGQWDWWREFFYDHPLLVQKDAQAYSNALKAKPKVFCKQCWTAMVAAENVWDQTDVLEGGNEL